MVAKPLQTLLDYSTVPAEPRTLIHLCIFKEPQRPSPSLCQREGLGRECQYDLEEALYAQKKATT